MASVSHLKTDEIHQWSSQQSCLSMRVQSALTQHHACSRCTRMKAPLQEQLWLRQGDHNFKRVLSNEQKLERFDTASEDDVYRFLKSWL